MTSRQATVLIVLLSVGVGFQVLSTVVKAANFMQKWEYKIDAPPDTNFPEHMNHWGAEGWEMVSARRATNESGYQSSYEVILKRPVR
jgi:hypothetical protein